MEAECGPFQNCRSWKGLMQLTRRVVWLLQVLWRSCQSQEDRRTTGVAAAEQGSLIRESSCSGNAERAVEIVLWVGILSQCAARDYTVCTGHSH